MLSTMARVGTAVAVRAVSLVTLAVLLYVPSAPMQLTVGGAPVAAMTAPVYQRVNPVNAASLTTPWLSEAQSAGSVYGYTTDLGQIFSASLTAVTGLVPIRRLYHSSWIDFAWAVQGSAAYSAMTSLGYVDQGTNFFALSAAVSGETVAINGYVKGNKRRLANGAAADALGAAGWTLEYTAFHVPASSVPTPAPVGPPPSAPEAGSATVGSTAYPVPSSGVVVVSPSGNDAAAGTLASPVRTITKAVALVPSGGTVVVRAGVYRESVTIAKPMTLQAYPNEAVWLDGTQPVSGWVADGAAWRRDNWTVRFDSSPTYVQGAPDFTQPYWQFINPSFPMAAHPDQVFIDGKSLRQVGSRAQLTAGTFFLDAGTSKLYLGSDPAGHAVEASTQIRALWVRSADVRVRGIGVRRFSPSVFHMGCVTVEQPRFTLENVIIEDSATIGISVLNSGAKLTAVTLRRSGMLGMHGRFADNLQLTRVLATQNNVESFNIAPSAGGVKLAQTRGVSARDSSFSGNFAHGFWEDMSDYNSTFVNSRFDDNLGSGLFLEISAKATIIDNTFLRNGEFGMKINNTSNVNIWNNTLVGNGRAINLVQDGRRNTNPKDPAVDPRIPWPDPEMPWVLGPVSVANNVMAETRSSANCVLCVEDYSYQMSAGTMRITVNGNVYHRANTSTPTWLVVWSRGSLAPYVFTNLGAFQATTGQDRSGREFLGSAIVDTQGRLVSTVNSQAGSIAQPLPADLAALAGKPAGSTQLGNWP